MSPMEEPSVRDVPPHPHATWADAVAAENDRAATLAAALERMRLERDRAEARARVAERARAEFRERLRETGDLASADETHLLNAMRHARVNAAAGPQRDLDTLVDGLVALLAEDTVPGTPRDVSTARTLLAAVRADMHRLRTGRARAESRFDELVKDVAKALDMPSNTPVPNLVSRAGAVRRELAALRREVSAREQAVPEPSESPAPGGRVWDGTDDPSWRQVKDELSRLGREVAELLRQPDGRR